MIKFQFQNLLIGFYVVLLDEILKYYLAVALYMHKMYVNMRARERKCIATQISISL